MRKSGVIVIVILLLIVMLGAGAVGYLSKGFKNWDYKDWFKQEQKEQEQNPPDINVPPDTDDTSPVEEVYAMSEHCIFSESSVSALANSKTDVNIVTGESIVFKAESSDGKIAIDEPVFYVNWANKETVGSIDDYLLLEPYDSYVKVTLLKGFTNSINLYAVKPYTGIRSIMTTLDYVGEFGGYVGKPYVDYDTFVTEDSISDFEFVPYGDNYKVNSLACAPAVKTSFIESDFIVSTELSINCDLTNNSFGIEEIFPTHYFPDFLGGVPFSSKMVDNMVVFKGLKSDFSMLGNFLKKYGLGILNPSIDPEELYMLYFPLLDNLYRLRNSLNDAFFRYDIEVFTQYFSYDYSIFVELGELGYELSYDINNPPADVTYPIHENNPFWRLVHDFVPDNNGGGGMHEGGGIE